MRDQSAQYGDALAFIEVGQDLNEHLPVGNRSGIVPEFLFLEHFRVVTPVALPLVGGESHSLLASTNARTTALKR